MLRIATSHFTFIKDTRDLGGKVDVIMGDARLSMESRNRSASCAGPDAFSSDAIPSTCSPRRPWPSTAGTAPDGVLAIHISNRYLDLEPVGKTSPNLATSGSRFPTVKREGLVVTARPGAPEQEPGLHDRQPQRNGESTRPPRPSPLTDDTPACCHHELVTAGRGRRANSLPEAIIPSGCSPPSGVSGT